MLSFVHRSSMQFLHSLRRKKGRSNYKYALVEEDDNYYLLSSHTLSKAEKKKLAGHTGTMKPMSAHDERTLNTAVAMANEITTKSMNDLDGEPKLPNSPGDRSKFYFKFPHLSLHHNALHEPEKESIGKQERRNFSEEAKSVPDIQSTITEESKLAYTSLIEQPMSSSTIISHMPARTSSTIPKPALRSDSRNHFHSLQKQISYDDRLSSNGGVDHQLPASGINELPLPPRNTKPKLVDKPRHIRKHPLRLPEAAPKPPVIVRPIIYQNACRHPIMALPTTSTTVLPASVDVCDGAEAKLDTNPFTNGPNSANPFNGYLDDLNIFEPECVDESDGDERDEKNDDGLVKDCSDHVSVEDLLEFADQKPCGRQRGVESDEVRVMCKVLKEEVTSEECLQALELSDWDVHRAIKVVRVKIAVEQEVPLQECSAELEEAAGDIVKASAALVLKRKEIKQ